MTIDIFSHKIASFAHQTNQRAVEVNVECEVHFKSLKARKFGLVLPVGGRRHLLKVVPVAILFVACGGGSDTYTSEMETEYLEACIEEAQASLLSEIDIDFDTASDVATDYCACTWSEITSTLAVADFEEMDADISAGGAMPAEINAIIDTCAESVFLSL